MIPISRRIHLTDGAKVDATSERTAGSAREVPAEGRLGSQQVGFRLFDTIDQLTMQNDKAIGEPCDIGLLYVVVVARFVLFSRRPPCKNERAGIHTKYMWFCLFS